MTRSVTLEGDVFEPRGLLTGGSRRCDLSSCVVECTFSIFLHESYHLQ
jgi:chromosome segregation ATPase